MLTIIIGIVLLVIGVWMEKCRKSSEFARTSILSISLMFIIFGLFAPINGYNEPTLVNEKNIIAVSRDLKGNNVYVIKAEDDKCVYRYLKNDNYINHKETIAIIKNAKINESDECKNPRLQKYKYKSKKSLFSLSLGSSYEQYVFYIPKGSVFD